MLHKRLTFHTVDKAADVPGPLLCEEEEFPREGLSLLCDEEEFRKEGLSLLCEEEEFPREGLSILCKE